MDYIDLLSRFHSAINPKNYFEIGCRRGGSLTLARCPSIAVDPEPEISVALEAPTRIFKETSDEFFARPKVNELIGREIDLAFIDGLHVAEQVLRDFMNVERYSHRSGVIVIDDVLPTDLRYATRQRETNIWCGDVYKIVKILKRYRKDLSVYVLDIEMKGACVVSDLDSNSQVLYENLSEIESDILSGVYDTGSIEKLRSEFDVLHPAKLESILQRLMSKRD